MLKNYYLLTKPGIIFGNLITMTAGFLLGSRGKVEMGLFAALSIGLGAVIASACVFNNYLDRHIDQKMDRTKNRPLAKGNISGKKAIFFALLLGIVGIAVLAKYTNLLTVFAAAVGFIVYVLLYSVGKTKTSYATLIGSISGATPPVVGYCAASNQLDLGAFLLFTILVLWQMPHFYAIAMYRFKDYERAGIPVLPVTKGAQITKIQMVLYVIAFTFSCSLLTFFGYAGKTYLIVTTLLGCGWLLLSLLGFKQKKDSVWARQMFLYSLVVILVFSFTVSIKI